MSNSASRHPQNRKCFAPNCRSGYKNEKKTSIFSVPKNELDFKIWQKCIPRSDRLLQRNDSLCEKHFKREDIIRDWKSGNISISLKVPRLKPGAIPTFFNVVSPKRKNRNGKQRKILTREEKRELRNLIQESKRIHETHEEKRKKEEERWSSYKIASTSSDTLSEIRITEVKSVPELQQDVTADTSTPRQLETFHDYQVVRKKIIVPINEIYKKSFNKKVTLLNLNTSEEIQTEREDSDNVVVEDFNPENFHNYAAKIIKEENKENIDNELEETVVNEVEEDLNSFMDVKEEFDEEEWLKNYLQNRKRFTEQIYAPQPKTTEHVQIKVHYELNCRICINSTSDLKPLIEVDENDVKFEEKIRTCFPDIVSCIELRDDEHYKLICEKCRENVNIAFTFRSMCQESNQKLQEYKEKQKMEMEEKRMKWKRRKSEETAVADASTLGNQRRTQTITNATVISTKKLLPIKSLKNQNVDIGHLKVVRMYNCESCNKNFPQLNQLWAHKRVLHGVRNLVCSKCGQKFTSLYRWKLHLNTHLPKSYKCFDCLRPFKTKEALTIHEKTHELTKKNYKCEMCLMTFSSKVALKHHKKLVHAISRLSNWMCEKCGKVLYSNYSYNYHMLIHTNSKPFKCEKCDKAFRSKASRAAHMIQIHTDDKPFICDVCGKQFKLKANLDSHYVSHTDYKPHECSLCMKKFRTKTALNIHQRTHSGERPYVCQDCGKDFTSINMRRQHILRDHLKVKNFKCDECGKEFYLKKNLHLHKKIHMKEVQYPCEICGRIFKTKHYLKKHMRNKNVHKDIDKVYECELCPEKFNRKIHLKYHVRIHKEEKQFKCDNCDNSYTSKSSLNYHMRHMHERELPCECCGNIGFCMNSSNVDIIDEEVDGIVVKIDPIEDETVNSYTDYESD